nr:unknown function [Klebsiella phage vB_Kpn_K62PH164C2]
MKAKVYFPHLLNLSRQCMKAYMENPSENGLDGVIGEIYFRAAYGLETVNMYEEMNEAFDINGYS